MHAQYRNLGVKIFFLVHDLLPVRMPNMFPPGADAGHAEWLRAIANFDGAIGVTKAVADDLSVYLGEKNLTAGQRRGFKVAWSHHGADISSAAPSKGLPDDTKRVLGVLKSRPTFLMVGTVEPRKGYLQTLEAFSLLWDQGCEANLVIVGREGWVGLPDEARRTIPETVRRLRNHPELGKRLIWLEGVSDEYLEEIYSACNCLIAASEGEGFGLPLIEAAQHKLPIIARDIPVFREVASEYAYYFDADTPADLAGVIKAWLQMFELGLHPKSNDMPWLTWVESARHLCEVLVPRM